MAGADFDVETLGRDDDLSFPLPFSFLDAKTGAGEGGVDSVTLLLLVAAASAAAAVAVAAAMAAAAAAASCRSLRRIFFMVDS